MVRYNFDVICRVVICVVGAVVYGYTVHIPLLCCMLLAPLLSLLLLLLFGFMLVCIMNVGYFMC